MGPIVKVYVGNKWRLILRTGINLDNNTLLQIRACKPVSGGDEAYSATRIGTTDKIYHDFSIDELDEGGLWKFQAYVEFAGGADVYRGTVYEHFIHELPT